MIPLVGVYFSSCLLQSEIQLRKEVETRQQLEQMLGDHRELIDALTAEILSLREENSTMQVFTCPPKGSMFDSEHVYVHVSVSWSCGWLSCSDVTTCHVGSSSG